MTQSWNTDQDLCVFVRNQVIFAKKSCAQGGPGLLIEIGYLSPKDMGRYHGKSWHILLIVHLTDDVFMWWMFSWISFHTLIISWKHPGKAWSTELELFPFSRVNWTQKNVSVLNKTHKRCVFGTDDKHFYDCVHRMSYLKKHFRHIRCLSVFFIKDLFFLWSGHGASKIRSLNKDFPLQPLEHGISWLIQCFLIRVQWSISRFWGHFDLFVLLNFHCNNYIIWSWQTVMLLENPIYFTLILSSK